ncbi:hypothetical protein HanRHA438_Chr11g0499001 [Helianthus annuus]|nr:hypothetical protein HanRHA438_Chr11g0499001 [Helianthus annuus]
MCIVIVVFCIVEAAPQRTRSELLVIYNIKENNFYGFFYSCFSLYYYYYYKKKRRRIVLYYILCMFYKFINFFVFYSISSFSVNFFVKKLLV